MIFPRLETQRLALRQLTPEDRDSLFDYFSRDEVTAYYDLETFTSAGQAEWLIDHWNARFEREEGIRWAVERKGEPGLIGTCGFHNWAKEHAKAEMGYELSPVHWGQGYMSEAVAAIAAYGFNAMKLNRIEAFTDPDNAASNRLLARCGFNEEGVLREFLFEKNRFADAVIFSLLRRDWETR